MVCRDCKHTRTMAEHGEDHVCKLTRHLNDDSTNPASGRPVGLLVTWLLEFYNWETWQEHQSILHVKSILLSEREFNRKWIKTIANGTHLCSFERKRRPGEGEEPAGDP